MASKAGLVVFTYWINEDVKGSQFLHNWSEGLAYAQQIRSRLLAEGWTDVPESGDS
jgi:hypothetical protein